MRTISRVSCVSLSLSHSTPLLKSLFCAFAFACRPICIDLGWRLAANCKCEQFKWATSCCSPGKLSIHVAVCVCCTQEQQLRCFCFFFWLFLFRLFALLLHFCFWLFSALSQLLRNRRRRCCRCYLIFTFFFIFGITWLYKHTDTRMYIHTYIDTYVCVLKKMPSEQHFVAMFGAAPLKNEGGWGWGKWSLCWSPHLSPSSTLNARNERAMT